MTTTTTAARFDGPRTTRSGAAEEQRSGGDEAASADRRPVVTTSNLSKSYGPTVGVANLDLELRAGEVFGFIGPNGAGKTTTIRLLLDLIRPTEGSASVFGLDVHDDAVEIHRRTGYLPGDLQLFDRLSANELFAWLGRIRGGYDEAFVADLAERLDLDCTRPIGDLSTGNRQKVGVVQAFMHRPDLLILDEPTSGLDPLVQRTFRTLVSEAKERGASVFLSSHVMAEVEDVCDRVGMIVDGRLRSVDTVADLKAVARRQVRLVLGGEVDDEAFSQLSSVSGLRRSSTASADTVLELEVVGSLDELIKAAAGHEVIDLVSEPTSLETMFFETYDSVENGTRSVKE